MKEAGLGDFGQLLPLLTFCPLHCRPESAWEGGLRGRELAPPRLQPAATAARVTQSLDRCSSRFYTPKGFLKNHIHPPCVLSCHLKFSK